MKWIDKEAKWQRLATLLQTMFLWSMETRPLQVETPPEHAPIGIPRTIRTLLHQKAKRQRVDSSCLNQRTAKKKKVTFVVKPRCLCNLILTQRKGTFPLLRKALLKETETLPTKRNLVTQVTSSTETLRASRPARVL